MVFSSKKVIWGLEMPSQKDLSVLNPAEIKIAQDRARHTSQFADYQASAYSRDYENNISLFAHRKRMGFDIDGNKQ